MSTRLWLAVVVLFIPSLVTAADLPRVQKVERQPLAAQAKRVVEALDFLGEPLSAEDVKALQLATGNPDQGQGVEAIQGLLDRRCVAGVELTEDGKLAIQQGPAKIDLVEQGWR